MNKKRTWLWAILFTSGLVLSVSDGRWFPFPNLLGLSLLTLFSLNSSILLRTN